MPKNRDIKLTETGVRDLVLGRDGDLVLGDTTLQNIESIVSTAKGGWKQWPTMGVGIREMVNDEVPEVWKREVVEQLKSDGMTCGPVTLEGGVLNINAKY